MTPERFAKLRRALERRQPDLTVLADGVNKPHNVSAILRTADAVGIQRIHAISTSGAMRRHHMIAGGVKNWVGLTLHGSIEHALAEADEHVAIPMLGLGESVNVSVATAVILLEAQRQRATAGFYDRPRLPPDELERTLFEWCYPDIAERCRELGRAYPRLGADGAMLENPLRSAS